MIRMIKTIVYDVIVIAAITVLLPEAITQMQKAMNVVKQKSK